MRIDCIIHLIILQKSKVYHHCVHSLPQCDRVPIVNYMVIEYRVVIVQNLTLFYFRSIVHEIAQSYANVFAEYCLGIPENNELAEILKRL